MTAAHNDEHPIDGGKSAFGKLTVLMVTAFIDMLGMLMILPLLPFYAKDLGAGGFVVGLLVSSFSVAQLLSAPLWGRFSDKHGRRPALIVGLASSAVAYVVFAYADSLWLLLLSRIVQGAGGGTVSVIQAYVADATRPEDRAKSLGWLSAATNAGVALGGISFATFLQPITLGVAAGLFFGKQIGILGACWLGVKLGIAKLPVRANWVQVYGVSLLCGIGFTISLFIGALAFTSPDNVAAAKLGVLAGSLIAGVGGWLVLHQAGAKGVKT